MKEAIIVSLSLPTSVLCFLLHSTLTSVSYPLITQVRWDKTNRGKRREGRPLATPFFRFIAASNLRSLTRYTVRVLRKEWNERETEGMSEGHDRGADPPFVTYLPLYPPPDPNPIPSGWGRKWRWGSDQPSEWITVSPYVLLLHDPILYTSPSLHGHSLRSSPSRISLQSQLLDLTYGVTMMKEEEGRGTGKERRQ